MTNIYCKTKTYIDSYNIFSSLKCQKRNVILHTESKQCHLLLIITHIVRGSEHITYTWYLHCTRTMCCVRHYHLLTNTRASRRMYKFTR
jgi:hypothetical protein